MIIAPPQLSLHLKKQLGKGYILIGECPLMTDETKNQIMQAWATNYPSGWDKKNLWIEEGDDWNKLYSEMQHFSLFNQPLFLDVRFNKKTLDAKGKHCLTQLTDMQTFPAFLILQAPLLLAKQFSALQKHPNLHLIEVKPLKGKAVQTFIENGLQRANLSFSRDVPAFIAEYTEGNIIATAHCIEQLILLHSDAMKSTPLTLDIIRKSLSDTASFPLYALIEACLQGNVERMLRILQSLKQTETEPLLIIWWLTKITRQLHGLLSGVANTPLPQLFQAFAIWSSQQNLYQQAMKRISIPTLSRILIACHHLDLAVKSNATLPIWETIEQVTLAFHQEHFVLSPALIQYE